VLSIAGTAFNSTARDILLDETGGGIEVVDAANTFTVDNKLSGAGFLIKQGSGTLRLTGANTYTGGTRVMGGLLAGDISSLQGAIVTQAGTTVQFSQPNDGRFNGTLSGSGTLRKEGVGALQVTGVQSISGGVDLRAGSLLLGDGATGATLGSAVTIAAGAALLGGGSVESVDNAGSVSAASAPGLNFTVTGNYTSQPGAALNVSLRDPNSAPLTVAGTAQLAGSLQAAHGFVYSGSDAYPILRASLVSGTFDDASLPDLAFFDTSLAYSSDSVTLALQRNALTIRGAGQTPNQGATGDAVASLPTGSALYEHIMGQGSDGVSHALAQLSGDSHAGLSSALLRNSSSARDLTLRHLQRCMPSGRNVKDPANGARPYKAHNCGFDTWAEIIGNWQRQEGNGNVDGYHQHLGGLMVGSDVAARGGWRVGAAIGFTDGKIWQNSRSASAETKSWIVSLYGGKAISMGAARALNVKAGAAYAWHELRTKRGVMVNSAHQKLHADYRGSTTQIFGKLGHEFPVHAQVTLEPFVGVAWIDQRMRSFSESGGSAANQQVTTTTVGVRTRGQWQLQGRSVEAFISSGWRHAFGEVNPKSHLQFQGSQTFTVAGTPLAQNAFVTEVGADVAVSRRARLGASYAGQFGKGSREHRGMINIRWRF
jgi:outer membrane autotransporter protein